MQQITCLNCPLRCSIDVEYDESAIRLNEISGKLRQILAQEGVNNA